MPTTIDRFMRIVEEDSGPGEKPEMRFVRVEEVISANLDELFPGKEVVASYVSGTRNADFVIEEDEAADLPQAIEDELESQLVRPECQGSWSQTRCPTTRGTGLLATPRSTKRRSSGSPHLDWASLI